ncbi:hypothetical protein BDN72DRAFT_851843 [Pluteus cervinus]|uniref:Uncharacterized protein n=1 Tax=Pluteus cervinus TaxID=181527 RepID=A0ACD2ZXK7_9AGAR|nr:hypothetical protein BDN72DRAFT_851843 [Pluteus cervinus]
MLLVTPYDKFSPVIRDVINHPCPISTLPVELLQEIFAFSMTAKPKPRIVAGVSLDEREPPVFQVTALILTWVCSKWRQIASSMPELWGTMTIYKPKKYCVELSRIYLSRSGNIAPLNLDLRQDVRLDLRTYPDPHCCPEHNATVDILKLWVPQAHRWRNIHLDLTYTPPLHELPKISPDALSGVQEAHLRFSETPQHSETVINWLWENIFRSPALRTAYWHDLVYGLPPAPFSELFEFRLFAPTADELLSVLPSCQRLKRLHVRILSKSDQPRTPSGPIVVLPSLEYFQLDFGEHSRCILDHISAPVLRELAISDSRQMPFSEARSLQRFLERSCCVLRALHLTQRWDYSEEYVIQYLMHASKYLAGLDVLSVECGLLSGRVVSLFVPQMIGDTISVPFPSLIDLKLCTAVTRDGVISSMVESRSVAGAPLWRFVCRVKYGPLNSTGYPKDDASFARLREEGLQLFWSSQDGPGNRL